MDLNIFNDSNDEELCSSINLYELEEEEKYIKKFSNNSFIKEVSLMNHNFDVYKSFKVLLNDFEKIKEKKEKDKIQFNNNFYNSFENHQMSDFFLKQILNV